MKLDLTQTIVAVSSGLASGRRAIVRVSGPATKSILKCLLSPAADARAGSPPNKVSAFLDNSHACYSRARCYLSLAADASRGRVPQPRSFAVGCYWWPDHRSFTGESSAEIHLIGSLPLVESLVESIVSQGARPAERGEFTLRSFLAGKVDLTQAEAVLGVIEADDEFELQQALAQLGGNISTPVRSLRDNLLELTAHLEAGLDFVEEDIQFISTSELMSQLRQIGDRLEAISLQLESRGSRSRTISVVLVGLPNAGKSSLFNALVGDERAIVSSTAGTTRDAISRQIRLAGLTVELTDTAGMEELQDASPRAMAQTVLAKRLARADAALFCVDLSEPPDRAWIQRQWSALSQKTPTLLVGTKRDAVQLPIDFDMDSSVSTRDAQSLLGLKQRLECFLQESRLKFKSQALHDTMVRCKQSIDLAHAALGRALQLAEEALGEELIAAELRAAIDDLSAVIGEVHTEDILGQIFSRFCIGK